jgi:hypothetical protein
MLGILLWVDSPLALSEPLVHTGSNITGLLGTTQARRHVLEMNSVRFHAREGRCVYFDNCGVPAMWAFGRISIGDARAHGLGVCDKLWRSASHQ